MSEAQTTISTEAAIIDEDSLMASLSPNELRMLQLLGNGISQELTASTCGVTPAYISQLMAQEGFASLVNKLRYEKLEAEASIDDRYNKMESDLQDKMEKVIPMLIKPRDILDFSTRINQMKRRNTASAPSANSSATVVVNLQLPTAIMNKLVIDAETNKVIEANGQELLTLPSNNMYGIYNDAKSKDPGDAQRVALPKGRAISANDL